MHMGRAIFDDITPPQSGDEEKPTPGDHSIRDIAPLATDDRKTRRAKRADRRKLVNPFDGTPGTTSRGRTSLSVKKFGVWIAAIAVLIITLSAVGFVFIGKTTITIVPQQESLNLSDNIVHTAYQDAEAGELQYTLLSHSIEATDSITATGRETVQEKASGQIVVYNNHSTATQRLIKNTRFEAPSGEIYRVRNSFVVPGMDEDGKAGSIEVTVYADKPGESQNISALGTKFTIPGLKGDKRFDTFHAELKAPITGGFVGERAIVDEDTLNASRTKLRAQLQDQVVAEITAKASDAVELFEGGIFTTFESREVAYAEDETATVREVAQIYAVTFKATELARMLAVAAVATPEDGDILIDNPENLTMTIINKEGVDISNDALIQFTLEGSTSLTWQVDTESLKQDLVGKHSGALNSVMSSYPGIKSAQATIRPFWRSEFPSETGSISVEILPES